MFIMLSYVIITYSIPPAAYCYYCYLVISYIYTALYCDSYSFDGIFESYSCELVIGRSLPVGLAWLVYHKSPNQMDGFVENV